MKGWIVRTTAAGESGVLTRFEQVRSRTLELCAPLEIEDYVVQTSPDVSPPKWHLAHTTWFFETFLLADFVRDYQPVCPEYKVLFNSYYNAVGDKHPRHQRGLLSRPTVQEVVAYRQRVDARMGELLESREDAPLRSEILRRLELGLHHEKQHQELLLMDIKYNFSVNPLRPAYAPSTLHAASGSPALAWLEFEPGLQEFGHDGPGFAYDNETPRHRAYLAPYALASRLVTNAEFMEFVDAGGYTQPRHWLADGWLAVQRESWSAPLYWEKRDGRWCEFTLRGLQALDDNRPVVHVSYFEADAFARWKQRRLPSELEWEHAASSQPVRGNFLDSEGLHPDAASGSGLQQMFGDVWEVTQSDYRPYHGYRAVQGALGEYNGKFMCGQYVQRGGSCVSPRAHLRATYRNYYYPQQRWNFQGLRLASDLEGGARR